MEGTALTRGGAACFFPCNSRLSTEIGRKKSYFVFLRGFYIRRLWFISSGFLRSRCWIRTIEVYSWEMISDSDYWSLAKSNMENLVWRNIQKRHERIKNAQDVNRGKKYCIDCSFLIELYQVSCLPKKSLTFLGTMTNLLFLWFLSKIGKQASFSVKNIVILKFKLYKNYELFTSYKAQTRVFCCLDFLRALISSGE